MEHIKQLYIFSLQPQTYPWAWARLLSTNPDAQQACVDEAAQVWNLILRLEGSSNPLHTELAKQLFISKAVTFREPFNILQANNYLPSGNLVSYVTAMHRHMASSLSLEEAVLILTSSLSLPRIPCSDGQFDIPFCIV